MVSEVQALEGRVAIVTGGAWGLGAATARGLAAVGAKVAIADIDLDRSEAVAESIREKGGQAMAVRTDMSDEASVQALTAQTVKAFGGLDILYNNAAILGAIEGGDGPLETMSASGWDQLYSVNVRGVMLGCKHAIPQMLARGRGSIINCTSSSADLGDLQAAYSSSKGAVSALTRSVAARYGKRGIRCNAIAPGLMLHEHNEAYIGGDVRALFLKHHLLDRLGTGEDVAQAVLFLASDQSAFITGQVLGVDGGLAVHLPYVGDMLEPNGFRWFG